jgi:hypothetical protein
MVNGFWASCSAPVVELMVPVRTIGMSTQQRVAKVSF